MRYAPIPAPINSNSMFHAPRTLRICFYAPFKPLGHVHPSGDLVTATGLFDFLVKQEHRVSRLSAFRCRWIYWKPWLWAHLIRERQRVVRRALADSADLWFTYHSYYKAPDMLGPFVSQKTGLPYVIFQGIYSTKRKRAIKTLPGFYLNKRCLKAASHVFVNKQVDLVNLARLLPADRITYVAPGISPADFSFDNTAREILRRQWEVGDTPVIFSAAMFRPDVKSEGLSWVIRACGELSRQGCDFRLVIAGDGKERGRLQKLAVQQIPQKVRFTGEIPRLEMYRYYSAADVFVFPGIRESLGMVFLEAQSCGLPVVAFDNAGVPEAVAAGKTGFLAPLYALTPLVDAMRRLLKDKELRHQMGRAAQSYVRDAHDIDRNYQKLEHMLQEIARRRQDG